MLYSSNSQAEYAVLRKGLSNLKIYELIAIGEDTASLLSKKVDEVALFGLTAEKIEDFKNKVLELSSLYHNREAMKTNLNNITQERIQLKSELFKLLRFVSRVGKAYWKRQNPAIYGDYVLSKHKSPPQQEVAQTNEDEMQASNF